MSELVERLQAALGDAYRIERELGGGGMSRVFLARETRSNAGRRQGAPAGARGRREHRALPARDPARGAAAASAHRAGARGRRQTGTACTIRCRSSRASRCARGSRASGELPCAKRCASCATWSTRSRTRTRAASSTATSSRTTSCSRARHAVVTDFGVAKALECAASAIVRRSRSLGVALGTPAYMAPEQAAADPHGGSSRGHLRVGVDGVRDACGRAAVQRDIAAADARRARDASAGAAERTAHELPPALNSW